MCIASVAIIDLILKCEKKKEFYLYVILLVITVHCHPIKQILKLKCRKLFVQ